MNSRHMPSKTEVKGHARRAQQRLTERFGAMLKGDTPQDHFVQAMTGAVFASIAVRLLRTTPIGALVSAFAPMAAFALIYQKLAEE